MYLIGWTLGAMMLWVYSPSHAIAVRPHFSGPSSILAAQVWAQNSHYWFCYAILWLIVRPCWAEIKYGTILAVGVWDFELWLLKRQKNSISSIFSMTDWQVQYSDRLTSPVLWQIDKSGTLTDWQVRYSDRLTSLVIAALLWFLWFIIS